MKHYGIWNTEVSKWMMTGDGAIIWSTGRAVMEAKLAEMNSFERKPGRYEVREFIDTPEEQKP